MSTGVHLNELERRQTSRKVAESSMRQMKHAALMSDEAEKTYNNVRKELKKPYKETLLMLTPDVDRLLFALKEVCRRFGQDPYAVFDEAVKAIPVSAEVEKALAEKEAKEAEKAAKSKKDLPGQKKLKNKKGELVGDDGSDAEPASEVTAKPLETVS